MQVAMATCIATLQTLFCSSDGLDHLAVQHIKLKKCVAMPLFDSSNGLSWWIYYAYASIYSVEIICSPFSMHMFTYYHYL